MRIGVVAQHVAGLQPVAQHLHPRRLHLPTHLQLVLVDEADHRRVGLVQLRRQRGVPRLQIGRYDRVHPRPRQVIDGHRNATIDLGGLHGQ